MIGKIKNKIFVGKVHHIFIFLMIFHCTDPYFWGETIMVNKDTATTYPEVGVGCKLIINARLSENTDR